jgi:hypothetical protein
MVVVELVRWSSRAAGGRRRSSWAAWSSWCRSRPGARRGARGRVGPPGRAGARGQAGRWRSVPRWSGWPPLVGPVVLRRGARRAEAVAELVSSPDRGRRAAHGRAGLPGRAGPVAVLACPAWPSWCPWPCWSAGPDCVVELVRVAGLGCLVELGAGVGPSQAAWPSRTPVRCQAGPVVEPGRRRSSWATRSCWSDGRAGRRWSGPRWSA